MPVTNSVNSILGTNAVLSSTLGNDVNVNIARKGDMVIGRYSSSVSTRVPVGENDYCLISDPTKPNWISWGASGTGKWVSRGIGGAFSTSGNGGWCPLTFASTPTVNSTLTANRLVCLPFIADRAWPITKISIVVQTFASSTSIRLGMYKADGTNGFPGTLLFDAGTVSSASNGTKTITLTLPIYVYGHYWIAYISDGAPTVTGFNSNIPEFNQALGRPDLITSTSGLFLYEDSVSSYFTALPSSLSSDTFTVASLGNVGLPVLGIAP